MAKKTLKVSYKTDTSLVLSGEEYLVLYLTDIPLRGLGGEKISIATIENKLRVATEQIEGFLSLKIPRQKMLEYKDYIQSEFFNWGFIKLDYLVAEVLELEGQLNFSAQIIYPTTWVSFNRGHTYGRNLQIVADQQDVSTDGVYKPNDFVAVFTGKFPIFGYSNADYIPYYWRVRYMTGYTQVPSDLQDVIGKLASMQVLAILGDISFGAGIASRSLSIDGLSQSINTTQSAENSLYSARVRQFERELKTELQRLKNKYVGITLMSM